MQSPDAGAGHEFLKSLKEQSEKRPADFDHVFEQLDRKARARGIPLSGQFELTPLCNLNCKIINCIQVLAGFLNKIGYEL